MVGGRETAAVCDFHLRYVSCQGLSSSLRRYHMHLEKERLKEAILDSVR